MSDEPNKSKDPYSDEDPVGDEDLYGDQNPYSDEESSGLRDAAAKGMSFLEHLEEFRWTVGRSLIAFLIGIILAAVFIGDIAQLLKHPLVIAYGSSESANENLITYSPMGVITVFIQIAFLAGLTLSMPFLLYFLAAFVAPGLTNKERKVLRPACFAAFALFVLGVLFAFFIILPLTLSFSVRLNDYFDFDLLWAASDYYNMVVWFSLTTGAFFQFPLIIVILVFLGVIPVQKLRNSRRVVFVGLMVLSAFLIPTGDFITLPITTLCMYSLYELAIWVGARVEKKKRAQALAEWDE